MQILKHFHVGEEATLQRSLVRVNGVTYRRIARWVDPATGELDMRPASDLPRWQEQIHNGDFHNIFSAIQHDVLEQIFVRTLIELNTPVKL